MPLRVEKQSPAEGVLLLTAHGEIDAHTYDKVEEAIADALDEGIVKIFVDLSSVAYMSSAGIGVLIGSMNDVVDGRGGSFILISPTEDVMAVLESMGFTPYSRSSNRWTRRLRRSSSSGYLFRRRLTSSSDSSAL